MHKLTKKVDAIELKTRQLIHKMESLERDNAFLVSENSRLKKDLNQYIDKIEELQKDVSSENKKDNSIDIGIFKQRIKQLAREVEVCIDLLNG